jgi:hypothetical protein
LRSKFGAVLGQALLDLLRCLVFDLLCRTLPARMAARGVSCSFLPLGLGLVEILDDPLVMLLKDVLGDTFHTEDLDVQAGSVRESILDALQCLFVNLVHVHGET